MPSSSSPAFPPDCLGLPLPLFPVAPTLFNRLSPTEAAIATLGVMPCSSLCLHDRATRGGPEGGRGALERDDRFSLARERSDICDAIMLTESLPMFKYYQKQQFVISSTATSFAENL